MHTKLGNCPQWAMLIAGAAGGCDEGTPLCIGSATVAAGATTLRIGVKSVFTPEKEISGGDGGANGEAFAYAFATTVLVDPSG